MRAHGWLYGPVPDLLLGCGLLYGLLFAAFGLFGLALRGLQPAYLVPLLVLLVSLPHYGGTLVRVYEHRADRRSFAIFSVGATLFVAALFVWGAFSSLVASWLFTIYITWSPWHYSRQNYGIAVMFLQRRGVSLSPGTRRLLFASFLLGFLLTFLIFHSALGVVDYNAETLAKSAVESSVVFLPLGIPASVHSVAFPFVLAAYLATLVASAALLLRQARVRDLGPAAAIVLTQALWFSIPFAVGYFHLSTGIEPIDVLQNQIQVYFMWVAIGHAAQYLWLTSYEARGSRGWRGFARYLGKVLASGVALWTLPVIAIAPVARGRLEYESGLAILLASAVNLHHFILDAAIWKRRGRPEPVAELPEPFAAERPWLRRAVWLAASGGLAVGLYLFWVQSFALRASSDIPNYAAQAAWLDRIALLGRDSSAKRVELALSAEHALDAGEADRQLRRAVELRPGAEMLTQLGHLHARADRWEPAAEAYEEALALAPDDTSLLKWTELANWHLDRLERVRELLEHQVELQPNVSILYLRLANIEKRLGDDAAATRYQREAVRLDPKAHTLRNDLAWTLATSRDEQIRDPAEAIRLAESLVHEAQTPDPNQLDTLAAAYAAAGRFDEAVRTASQAASLAVERGQMQLSEEIRSRLALYRSQRPYVSTEASNGV